MRAPNYLPPMYLEAGPLNSDVIVLINSDAAESLIKAISSRTNFQQQ